MKMKLYESYGVLAHEKKPVYTIDAPASEAYNVITVYIPDEFKICNNIYGEKLIEIKGETYLLSDILTNYGEKPCLWFGEKRGERIMLEVI